MRIVHVVTRLLRAGSEENTLACCRWQAEAGHEVVLVHGAEADAALAAAAGVRCIALPEMVHPIRPYADARHCDGCICGWPRMWCTAIRARPAFSDVWPQMWCPKHGSFMACTSCPGRM